MKRRKTMKRRIERRDSLAQYRFRQSGTLIYCVWCHSPVKVDGRCKPGCKVDHGNY